MRKEITLADREITIVPVISRTMTDATWHFACCKRNGFCQGTVSIFVLFFLSLSPYVTRIITWVANVNLEHYTALSVLGVCEDFRNNRNLSDWLKVLEISERFNFLGILELLKLLHSQRL